MANVLKPNWLAKCFVIREKKPLSLRAKEYWKHDIISYTVFYRGDTKIYWVHEKKLYWARRSLWGSLEKARHVVPIALLVRVQRLCWRHTVPILTHDGHTNMIFLISREVTPEDGNKIIFNRRLRDGCGRLHDVSRTIHGDNTKDTRS